MPSIDGIYGCPVENILAMVSGKWKPAILYELFHKTMRFGQLQRAVPQISRQVLTIQLRELERDGLVTRTVYPVVPPKVEYSITTVGKELESILEEFVILSQTLQKRE